MNNDTPTSASASVAPAQPTSLGGRPLRVLLFSARDNGGAGIAAYRLHRGLIEAGVDSKMIVLNKEHSEDNTVGLLQLNQNGQKLAPWPSFCLAMQTAQQELRDFPARSQTSEMFSTTSCCISLQDLQGLIRQTDVINVHWCAGLFDYQRAPQVLAGKSIVWTLHDMNIFTGGCHYAEDCLRYQSESGCTDCPQLGSGPYDLASQIWATKQKALAPLDITVVSPSQWLADCARKSRIFSGRSIRVIPYGLPLDIYRPQDVQQLRRQLGLPVDGRIILFGCESLKSHRKGFDLLLKAMEVLPEQLLKREDVSVCVFGEGNIPDSFPFPVHPLGKVSGDANLARIYAAADVYVISTREDNLPNTVLESLACGTPVAGFRVGGLPDMIHDDSVGELASAGDCRQLATAVASILNRGRAQYASACRERAEELYPLSRQARLYRDLYTQLASRPGVSCAEITSSSAPANNAPAQRSLRDIYNNIGLAPDEIAQLDKLFPDDCGSFRLQDLWSGMDRVWEQIGCDAENPTPESLGQFYRHPIWALNGWFGEHDPESVKYRMGISKWIAANAPAAGIRRLLDYGGGWASVDRMIAQENGSLEIDVYEPYPNPAAAALAKPFTKLRFVDQFAPPYDCVLAVDVLEHSCDMLKSLEELISLTRSGGLVITGNCFDPVIRCHLPRNMHFKKTFVQFAERMGLKKLGFVYYFEIFQKVGNTTLSEQDWKHLRAMEQQSACLANQSATTPAVPVAPVAPITPTFVPECPQNTQPGVTVESSARSGKDILVSAITSTYKSERYIRACLEDLVRQTLFQDGRMEIIVVNSNSPENEDAVIREYMSRHPNIQYIRTSERETLYKAWNRGVEAARGKYLTNANTDDRHIPQCLQIMAQALDESGGGALAYADIAVTEDEGVEIGRSPVHCLYCWPEYDRDTFFANNFFGPQPMWRADLHRKYGYFDPQMKCSGDFDLWLRMAAGGERFVHVPRILGLMLKSSQSLGLHNGQLTFDEAETGRRRSWNPGWGPLPAQRGIPVVKRIAPEVNPYGAFTSPPPAPSPAAAATPSGQSAPTASAAAPAIAPDATAITLEQLKALIETLSQKPQDEAALAQLRMVRAGFAQSILNMPAGEFSATYQTRLRPVVELLHQSALRYLPRLPQEDQNLADLRQQLTGELSPEQHLKSFCLLTLYVNAYEAQIPLTAYPFDSTMQKLALDFALLPPAVFVSADAPELYARHMFEVTRHIHERIQKSPDAKTTVDCAGYLLQYENYVSVYFNTLNLRDVYRQRAEILTYSLRRNGYRPDWIPPKRAKDRAKIRLGFLKAHYAGHTETYTSLPFFEHLDRERFEVILFSLGGFQPGLSQYCAQRADQTVSLPSDDIRRAADLIRAQDIDVLVFCTNLTAVTNHMTVLACHKMARVQLTNHSSPVTSGMPYADGYINGEDVIDSPEHYTEKLYRLPGCSYCFAYAADTLPQYPDFTREQFGLKADDHVFVSGANFYKIIPSLMDVWARILARLPKAKLVLLPFSKAWNLSYPEQLFIHTFKQALARRGAAESQLVITRNLPDRNAVLKLLKISDVCLDAIPYSGANSVFDPLEAGRPMICVAGNTFRTDQGPAILRAAGLQELIAPDEQAYIDLAIRLATDREYHEAICERIRGAMSGTPFFLDRVAYGRAVGDLYMTAWQDYLKR